MNEMLTSMTLLSQASSDGDPVKCRRSGRYCLSVCGTFGGATVGLKLLGPDGSTWIDVEDDSGAIAITSAKTKAVLLPAGQYKATVTGGSGASLYASLDRVID